MTTPLTEAELLACLTEMGIPYTHHTHPPLFTVEDSRALRGGLPGAHCKNMFLKAKSGDLILVTCEESRKIRIRDLEREIEQRKCSFAKPELLLEALGVTPGAVTPLALFNDKAQRVTFVMDAQLVEADILNCHPLHNAATVAIAMADMMRILKAIGHTPRLVDFDELEEKARQAAA